MGRSVRVLLVTHVFPRWPDDAAAPFLLRHAHGLAAAGLRLRVLAPHAAGLPDEHEVEGVPVRRFRYGREAGETLAYRGQMHRLARTPAGAVRAVRLVAALRRAVRQEVATWRPDVVDVHWIVPAGVALTGLRLPVPRQLNVHGTDLALLGRGPLTRRLGRRALADADAVAAMSAPLAAELQAALGRRADAVSPMPPAPPPPPSPLPGTGPVLAVGRLVPEKGHADLIEAVAGLRPRPPVVIVGDGPERGRLAALAAARGVAVDLPGARAPAELERHYAAARVVAVPSHREGFGLVAAEALARHRPVVATAAGGLAEIVRDGETGWVVPPRDPTALRAALEAVLADPQESRRRADAGAAAVAERWSAEALGKEAADRLRRLAGR